MSSKRAEEGATVTDRRITVRSPTLIEGVVDLWESAFIASRGVRPLATFARAPVEHGVTIQLWLKPRAIGPAVPWTPDVDRWLRVWRVPAASLHQEALRFSAFLAFYLGTRARPSAVVPLPPAELRVMIAQFVADRRREMPRSFERVTHAMPAVDRPAARLEQATPVLRAVTKMIAEMYTEPATAAKILDAAIADYLTHAFSDPASRRGETTA